MSRLNFNAVRCLATELFAEIFPGLSLCMNMEFSKQDGRNSLSCFHERDL